MQRWMLVVLWRSEMEQAERRGFCWSDLFVFVSREREAGAPKNPREESERGLKFVLSHCTFLVYSGSTSFSLGDGQKYHLLKNFFDNFDFLVLRSCMPPPALRDSVRPPAGIPAYRTSLSRCDLSVRCGTDLSVRCGTEVVRGSLAAGPRLPRARQQLSGLPLSGLDRKAPRRFSRGCTVSSERRSLVDWASPRSEAPDHARTPFSACRIRVLQAPHRLARRGRSSRPRSLQRQRGPLQGPGRMVASPRSFRSRTRIRRSPPVLIDMDRRG